MMGLRECLNALNIQKPFYWCRFSKKKTKNSYLNAGDVQPTSNLESRNLNFQVEITMIFSKEHPILVR